MVSANIRGSSRPKAYYRAIHSHSIVAGGLLEMS